MNLITFLNFSSCCSLLLRHKTFAQIFSGVFASIRQPLDISSLSKALPPSGLWPTAKMWTCNFFIDNAASLKMIFLQKLRVSTNPLVGDQTGALRIDNCFTFEKEHPRWQKLQVVLSIFIMQDKVFCSWENPFNKLFVWISKNYSIIY